MITVSEYFQNNYHIIFSISGTLGGNFTLELVVCQTKTPLIDSEVLKHAEENKLIGRSCRKLQKYPLKATVII